MIRLNLLVEGQSEEAFANQVLSPHLAQLEVLVAARMVTTRSGLGRRGKGGHGTYGKIRNDLMRWIREDRGQQARFSTLFDRYGLPMDFPGLEAAPAGTPHQLAELLEEAFAADIQDFRFVPYLQLHEFEALISRNRTSFW